MHAPKIPKIAPEAPTEMVSGDQSNKDKMFPKSPEPKYMAKYSFFVKSPSALKPNMSKKIMLLTKWTIFA